MNENPDQHSIRRIVLPSGKCIEVVRFSDPAAPARPGLHICLACKSELVQAVAWTELPDDRWELTLHCPNCDLLTEGTFAQEQVHALEDKLDEGLAAMLLDLRRLTTANMSEEIDRFAGALDRDLILPEDF